MSALASHRFEALDGLRGLFALLIAIHHLRLLGHFFDFPLVRTGYLAVDFFFVLSGFVITYAARGKLGTVRQAGIFMLRRFGRVWPLHAAVLVVLIGYEGLKWAMEQTLGITGITAAFAPGGSTSFTAIVTNLLLIQSLGTHGFSTWNGPAWSISTEFYTYLIFAVLALGLRRWLTPGAALLALASAVLLVLLVPNINTMYDYGILRCLYGFMVGHLTFHLFNATRGKLARPAVTEFLCLLLAIGFPIVAAFGPLSLLAPLIFAIPVWVFAYQQGPVSRLLTTGPAQLLGYLSYSIYLTHTIVLLTFERTMTILEKLTHQSYLTQHVYTEAITEAHPVYVIGNAWTMDLLAVIYLAVVIAFAYLATRFVETPTRLWFNALAQKLK